MTITSIAAAGLTRDEKHNYRWNGADPLPSVTTILGVVDKSGPLVGWAKREVSNAAVRNLDTLAKMVETAGPDSAARWLATIPGYQRDVAADIGTTVHELTEALSRGDEVHLGEDVAPYIAAYRQFLVDFKPRFFALEEMVISLRYGYGGTFDWIAEIEGETWLGDNKTSKGVYAETAYQLAAYWKADFIGRPGNPQKFRLPRIDRFGVLHLRPEGYELVEFAVDEETFEVFRSIKRLYDYQSGPAKRLMGTPTRGPDGWMSEQSRKEWGSLRVPDVPRTAKEQTA